ncbi:similar to Saccharomyces cerevisiae YHR189W PTH1 One of two (see also PTH2) mitochondrially- localized peptidyl-tRNA hydrolases [Maudiozyma barnettii]|uniref:Peptidyl-tRNA hydrolase n=1 Tax=Maudiozyma barnettii TaxID=61262 RepID=A0A8H2VC84_9SACH|nr:aminoacyl-tRNA hydrolase [Kazachstania barnettii]CAB4252617.1 similar to Saccharomyces cerevisiae YHR189W PTH1 One of two (see also PTH2) mitochondrially- localized peptidyl-tRNA hydrolases [Kazachstania barnettii]CAD1780073.1 similar to Saccharomyces cerevisiae YHR189W PTH1 One of two (see also PTH2) mitochondrially- localized peptidyl-tRNA hydrolases [Kazachstania barnettii]
MSSSLRNSLSKKYTCLTGLANPEPHYRKTRHNVGVLMLDLIKERLEQKVGTTIPYKPSTRSKYIHYCSFKDIKVNVPPMRVSNPNTLSTSILCLLRSDGNYMNLSGETIRPVWQALSRAIHGTDQLTHIVLHDELSLPLGKVQLRVPGRSLRGHNGLKDILRMCPDIPHYNLSIGIGRPESHEARDVADYVLGKFNPAELEILHTKTLDQIWQLLHPDILKFQSK